MRRVLTAVLLFAAATLQPAAAEPETAQDTPGAARLAPDCERKVTCGSLKSCAQACGFYQQCGLGTLDRDDDGIPCESICKATCDARG